MRIKNLRTRKIASEPTQPESNKTQSFSAIDLINMIENDEMPLEELSPEKVKVIQKAILSGEVNVKNLPAKLLDYLDLDFSKKINSPAINLIDMIENDEVLLEELSSQDIETIKKEILSGKIKLEDLPPELLDYLNFDTKEDEEEIQMPHSPSEKEKQLSFNFNTKKYTPGMVIAKICPRCGYHNRPIYKKECERCKKLYDKLNQHIKKRQSENPNFLESTAFREMATKYSLDLKEFDPETEEIIHTPTLEILKNIYETKGITPLNKVYEVRDSAKKELEDAMWYRLNVEKDKDGNIVYDEKGLPKQLEKQKYYGTEDLIQKLHLTPDKFKDIINQYNENIINNLPESVKNIVKYDENGHVIPSSASQLKPYGFIAPALVFGTGMADVKQTDSSEPRSKTSDIAAWDWEKARPAFGWDPEKKQFTHGWVRYLKDVFEPQNKRYELTIKRKALQKLLSESVRAEKLLKDEADKLWATMPIGAKVLNHLKKGNTKESMEEKLQDQLEEFKQDKYPILNWYNKNKKKFENVSGELAIMENKEKVPEKQLESVKQSISEKLSIPLEDVEQQVEKYFNAQHLEQTTPKSLYYLQYLRVNPTATKEKLEKQFDELLTTIGEKIKEKLNQSKNFQKEAKKLIEKIDKINEEIKNISPTELDLNEELKNVNLFEQTENQRLKEIENEMKKENPPPSPEEKRSNLISTFLKIRGGKINKLLKLSDKQLSLFDDVEKEDVPMTGGGLHMWGPKDTMVPIKEKTNVLDSLKKKTTEDFEPKPELTPKLVDKTTPETLKKVVVKTTMIRSKQDEKDSSGRTIIDPTTGEPQEKTIMFPKREHWIITFEMENDEPVRARCDKVSATYKPTGERILVPKYKDIWKKIKNFTKDKEKQNYFYSQICLEQKNDENPWEYKRSQEMYVSKQTTKCEECGSAKAPFDSACPQIQWAFNSLSGDNVPSDVKVYDYENVNLKEEKLSPSEERIIKQKHNITDF
jgi:hypothetical protein